MTKDPHLTMLEARNTPVDNYRSPADLAVGRQLRSVLPVNSNKLKIKTIDDDEIKEKIRRNKASIIPTHKGNEGVKIWGSSVNVKR